MNQPHEIQNWHELADFVDTLRKDLQEHSDQWENVKLDDYLESMSAWIRDSFMNSTCNPECLTQFAQILQSPKHYE